MSEFTYVLDRLLLLLRQVYYVLAVIEDLIFRSLWTLNISVGEAGARFLQGDILGTILSVMEVFRRFVWNFFRVENEHLNNVGEFRAVRDIAVVPINTNEVSVDEEEEVGVSLRPPRVSTRRISDALIEVYISSYNIECECLMLKLQVYTSRTFSLSLQLSNMATGFRNRRSGVQPPSGKEGNDLRERFRRGSDVSTSTETTLMMADGPISAVNPNAVSPIHEEEEDDGTFVSSQDVATEDGSDHINGLIEEMLLSEGAGMVTVTATVHPNKDD